MTEKINTMNRISINIKQIRQLNGLTQMQLSQRTTIPQCWISLYEHGMPVRDVDVTKLLQAGFIKRTTKGGGTT